MSPEFATLLVSTGPDKYERWLCATVSVHENEIARMRYSSAFQKADFLSILSSLR
jgi:hypothetical protein